MAKKFMFICLGILALMVAYSLGASNVDAQVSGASVVGVVNAAAGTTAIVTANGDFWARPGVPQATHPASWTESGDWTYMGNCFGGPISSQQNSLGGVKGLFR